MCYDGEVRKSDTGPWAGHSQEVAGMCKTCGCSAPKKKAAPKKDAKGKKK